MSADRYGNTKIAKIKAAYDDLRAAVRAGDNEAAQAALDRYEQWADFAFAPHTDLSQASVAAALEAAATGLDNEAAALDADALKFRGGSDANYTRQVKAITARTYANAIRALITPAQHDALAAHVAAELAKARAEDAATVLRYRPTGENAKHFVDVLVCGIANEILTGKKAK